MAAQALLPSQATVEHRITIPKVRLRIQAGADRLQGIPVFGKNDGLLSGVFGQDALEFGNQPLDLGIAVRQFLQQLAHAFESLDFFATLLLLLGNGRAQDPPGGALALGFAEGQVGLKVAQLRRRRRFLAGLVLFQGLQPMINSFVERCPRRERSLLDDLHGKTHDLGFVATLGLPESAGTVGGNLFHELRRLTGKRYGDPFHRTLRKDWLFSAILSSSGLDLHAPDHGRFHPTAKVLLGTLKGGHGGLDELEQGAEGMGIAVVRGGREKDEGSRRLP